VTAGADHPRPPVEVVRASLADRAFLGGMFQYYIYDFSEFQAAESPDFELNAEGRFDPYPLDGYWSDPGRIPLLIRIAGRTVGFALINDVSHAGETCDRSMAEFFVLRKHRRDGVGARAVAEILARYPGRWEIAIARRNIPALAFWPRVVGALDGVRGLRTKVMDEALWRGPVLMFEVVAAS
jgi:predicted acetyltransferase